MNDELGRQILRQQKIMNFWLAFFGSLIILSLLVVGFFMFQAFMFLRNAEQKINTIQNQTTQTLDVKSDLCKNEFVRDSAFCKQQ